MRTRQTSLLLHPLFLISLSVLLLNDFYFKYEFHNWLTGKLSDFAGLFTFSVFLIVFFPFNKKKVLLLSCLFFLWWKSPLSDPFILFLNNRLYLPVHRVIDFSDCTAITVIPLAYYIKPLPYSPRFIRTIATWSVCIISFFSFTATSMYRHLMYDVYDDDEINYYQAFSSPLTEKEILARLDPGKRGYQKDSIKYYRIRENENFYYKLRKDSTITWVPLANTKDSALFVKRENLPVYFLIPQYVLQTDTLSNLALRIYHNPRKKRNPTTIEILSFQTNHPADYIDFYQSRKRKQYTKHFKSLFG